MKKQPTTKQKQRRARGWVLAKQIYPLVMIVLILISLAIPALRYTTAGTGTREEISQWELMGNSWEQSRQYLFGRAEQTSGNLLFCRAVLGTLIGCGLAFFVGAVATVWYSAGAIYYMMNPAWRGTGRVLYLTLFPNRAVCCLWSVLLLPLLIFPRLLVFYYQRFFYYSVLLNVTFVEPIIIGLVLFAVLVGLFIGFSKSEERLGVSPYPKKTPRGLPEEREEEESTVYSGREEEDELTARAREEQMERIRRLLDKSREESLEEKENENE